MTDSCGGRNWRYGKRQREGNIFIQEILVHVPQDPFLPGTVLKRGARGKTIEVMRKRLDELYKNGDISTAPSNQPYLNLEPQWFNGDALTWVSFASYLEKETAEGGKLPHLRSRYEDGNYDVDREIWESMGLTVSDHLDEMFEIQSNAGHGATTINVKLEEDTITIEYKLSIYVERPEHTTRGRPSGSYIVMSHLDHKVEWRLYLDYIAKAIEGIYRWEKNTPAIQGVTPKINIKIFDKDNREFTPSWLTSGELNTSNIVISRFAATSKGRATIYVEEDYRGPMSTWVPDSIDWKKAKHLQIHVRNRAQEAENCNFAQSIEHEFGHVLGLFDAYGYGYGNDPKHVYGEHFHLIGNVVLPPADIDGIHVRRDSVMLDNGGTYRRTATDLAMLLYAWQENKLQCYIKSALGEQSQAYFH